MNWQELKRNGAEKLEKTGIENAAYDAKELLLFVSGFTPSTYPLHMQENVPEEVKEKYQSLIKRRARHEPLQYITGTAYFYGETFYVEPGVLIPRYDTETLIEALLPHLEGKRSVLDLCCGSGCILTTLLLNGPEELHGTGADLSETAVHVTKKNLKKFGMEKRANVVKSDLFSALTGSYDIIASNPPYIPSGDLPDLQSEVRDFEPKSALDGGSDGLIFYRRISQEASDFLNPKGILAFEIGYDEGESVQEIMKREGFADVSLYQDLSGRDRVVLGEKK